jgi:hypothetical protein
MSGKLAVGLVAVILACGLGAVATWYAFRSPSPSPALSVEVSTGSDLVYPITDDPLDQQFPERVQPFLDRYCYSCHGPSKHKAGLDLTHDSSAAAVTKNLGQWELVLERLQANEMPPEEAKHQPEPVERAAVVAWIRELRDRETRKTAGDPGIVLAHRLSNAEFDYTIRDLTGVDIRPTREFPVDPANEAGFDNSGESLSMSPALAKKFLAATRLVADHVVLKQDGFEFAPHPVVTETDRDKYCVLRIIDFYERHKVDLADYFLAAWKYRHREQLGRRDQDLSGFASEARLSPSYLALVWSALCENDENLGPLAAVHAQWQELPASAGNEKTVHSSCERMRDLVLRMRKQLKPPIPTLKVNGISPGSQPLVLWSNRQQALRHRKYSGEVVADLKKLREQLKEAESGLGKLFVMPESDTENERRMRTSLERFCTVFPDAFFVSDRGPYFSPNDAGKGRPLTAGFHLMQGYFRDDDPLRELILDDRERHELDRLWDELNFVSLAPQRQYKDFIFFERAEPPRFMREAEFDFARSEDQDAISEPKMARLAEAYLAKARKQGAQGESEEAIKTYFTSMSAEIRRVESARLAAEPSHLTSLLRIAERAYRRPLTGDEREKLLAFYRNLRKEDELNHEDAIRAAIASILMSPDFLFRFTRIEAGKGTQPLTDYELASRLSYFLWSSLPDAELLAHAAAGDLHQREVLIAQAQRMLRDPKVRGLATEFVGNWLDFRRFEEHNSVDRQRFPAFTNDLRQAMYEEPIRYFVDVASNNRSVLDLLYGNDTFVNRSLARHYGMPDSLIPKGSDDWVHVEDAGRYGRGGILPMAVFLTKNAPGLRTSPVKRGYWVVRRVLGEQIPPPPPTVPELPKDEANLGDLTLPQLLARHREDRSCAACHRRFDSVGLAFEGFGPIGERRSKDLGNRPVQTTAIYPDGKERDSLAGLREYLGEKRQNDYLNNLCRKLLAYALGRTFLLSDQPLVDEMRRQLSIMAYSFGNMVETIVTSPQFLNKRGEP